MVSFTKWQIVPISRKVVLLESLPYTKSLLITVQQKLFGTMLTIINAWWFQASTDNGAQGNEKVMPNTHVNQDFVQ